MSINVPDHERVDLFSMPLHSSAYVWNATYEILRVPGGWMYTHRTNDGQPSSCFVPFHNGFQSEGSGSAKR